MASRHQELLAAGAQLVGISVDSAGQQAAMVDTLKLTFSLLSDPGGEAALKPLDVFDPDERGGIGRPAVILATPDGHQAFRRVGRDYADRSTEDELLERVRALGLPPTHQPPPLPGEPQPGPQAMPLRAMLPYYRGAKFAARAMGRRHPEVRADAERYVAQMDRYMEVVRQLRARVSDQD